MHLVLLLLIQVHAEWVEIYQQHYKKPLRPSYTYTALEKPSFERTTKGNRIYINNSLPEYNWNKAIHHIPNDDTLRYEYETSSKTVISKHEISEQVPETIINVKNVESKKKAIIKLPKPVTIQSVKTADFITQEVPKINDAVIVQRLKTTKATVKPIKYDDFETKRLEVYNLSDVELITEDYTTPVINNKNIYSPLTTSEATIFRTPSKHSLVTKTPDQELTESTEEDLFEDDWPTNEGRYEYVVKIVPSNSNKRRVDIVRNTVNSSVLKTKSDKIFGFHKPNSTGTPKSKNDVKIDNDILSFDKIIFERDTTVMPKIQSSSKPQNLKQKPKIKASSTTIQPEPEIETAIFEGNKEQTKLIHLSTNIHPKTELKVEKIQSNSPIPSTDPDKVMIHEILIDQAMSSEITTQKLSQSNAAIIKKVYPTKIVKVDKNGQEIDGAFKVISSTEASFTNDELKIIQHNKENQDKNLYKIPYQASIKQAAAITQKSFNSTKEKAGGIIRPLATQTTQDLEEVIISVNDDEHYKKAFKENFKPTLKVTTKETPTLSTAQTKYNINTFDRDTEPADSGSYERYITLQHKIPEFITKEEDFTREQEFDSSKVNVKVDIDLQKYEDVETSIKKVSDEMVTENPSQVKNDDKEDNFNSVPKDMKQETLSNENKPSTMETLMKVLKIVTNTIRRNTRKNVNSKVRYLEHLRDTISRSIGK